MCQKIEHKIECTKNELELNQKDNIKGIIFITDYYKVSANIYRLMYINVYYFVSSYIHKYPQLVSSVTNDIGSQISKYAYRSSYNLEDSVFWVKIEHSFSSNEHKLKYMVVVCWITFGFYVCLLLWWIGYLLYTLIKSQKVLK